MTEPQAERQLDVLFSESDGQPVEWSGKHIWKAYRIPEAGRFRQANVTVLNFKDEPVQGICLRLAGGKLELEGQQNEGMALWMDTAPTSIDIGLRGGTDSVLEVWNCWRGRFGERAAWLRNAGVSVDASADGAHFRFGCSDGPGPVDFTALEFELTLGG
jgi:hypothetical protein